MPFFINGFSRFPCSMAPLPSAKSRQLAAQYDFADAAHQRNTCAYATHRELRGCIERERPKHADAEEQRANSEDRRVRQHRFRAPNIHCCAPSCFPTR
jgi:hypothetical protein